MMATNVYHELPLELTPCDQQHSRYDWWNIDCGHQRIGKVKGLVNGNKLIIHSIYISPKFERDGFTSEVVTTFKSRFDTIIADRVQHSSRWFWQEMGFEPAQGEEYEWRREN